MEQISVFLIGLSKMVYVWYFIISIATLFVIRKINSNNKMRIFESIILFIFCTIIGFLWPIYWIYRILSFLSKKL